MPSFSFIKKSDRKPKVANRRAPSGSSKGSTGLPQMRKAPTDGIPNASDGKTSRGTVDMGTHDEQVTRVSASSSARGQPTRERALVDSGKVASSGMNGGKGRIGNLGKFAWPGAQAREGGNDEDAC